MHRPYDTDVFSKAVKLIRLRVPGAAITTDVIVGFPGETESDFRDSLEYCRISRFAGIHAFSFSSRPNTPAAGFDGAVSEPVRHMRLQSFLILAKESSRLFRQQFIGNVMPILWESRPEAGDTISGLTPNYMRVETIYQPGLDNTIASGRLVAFKGSTIKVDLT
jgi:threonylcarbamoyladenosine tRNA methylthiotransferase MtaB